MRAVPDPRSPRAKKHDLAEMLTCIIVAYVSGHTTMRRAVSWCKRHLKWLRKGLVLKNGIASVPTISRMLSEIDEELFLYAFMEWIGEILDTRGRHLAIDGKALRAAVSRVKGGATPLLMNTIDVATSLVVAQFPLLDKTNEIKTIPKLLELLNIKGSIITIDAIGTQTEIMEQICKQEGHFLLMVKKNQPNAFEEISDFFKMLEKAEEDGKLDRLYPELSGKYGRVISHEKNRDRHEYRDYRCCNDASCLTKSRNEWSFIKSVGYIRQTRILLVRNEEGKDTTPCPKEFKEKGTRRQEMPKEGDGRENDIQIVGIVSDLEMNAEDMGRRKRAHWGVENRLHHVLDDTFREDRSPAKRSKNNLALIRKFAYNILRIAMLDTSAEIPMTEMMDLFSDDASLISKYIFTGIACIY